MEGAVDAFHTGTLSFQNILENLADSLKAEQQELQAERDKLLEEQQRFAAEVSRIEQVLNPGEKVTLNVGGQHFCTSVATLRNAPAPSLFAAMFSGRHSLTPDGDGSIFIDRDPRHFHAILNFLRDSSLSLQQVPDEQFLLELRTEADYYGLEGLVEKICAVPFKLTTVHRAARVSAQHVWEYDTHSGRDEIVFTVSAPVQLLGVGICAADSPFTASVALEEVEEQRAEHCDIDEHDIFCEYKSVSPLEQAQQTFLPVKGQLVSPLYFRRAVPLQPGRTYMLGFSMLGLVPNETVETFSAQGCLAVVDIAGLTVRFMYWESNNGTCQERGQFPELYLRIG